MPDWAPEEVDVRQERSYTMRDLNQRTAEVIKEINETGLPAVITRHGRFVALITPLANSGVEQKVLAAFLDSSDGHQLLPDRDSGPAMTAAEMSAELDLNLPNYADRPI